VTVVSNAEAPSGLSGRGVRLVCLGENLGPAGGFRRGLLEAFCQPGVRWAYLLEDDVALTGLPFGRLARLLPLLESAPTPRPVGAVLAYGRRFVGRFGHTENFLCPGGWGLARVDVGAWGATLVSRATAEAGVWPDPQLFFGYEDFDFFLKVAEAGFEVLVDCASAAQVAPSQTGSGRRASMEGARPGDEDEPWRAYYSARNFFHLARRHGRRSWLAWHLATSVRRLQLASGAEERRAILHGLVDGARGRRGSHPRYQRRQGEL